MNAMEFHTTVIDGKIEVPEEYRDQIRGKVRVIIFTEDQPRGGHDKVRELIDNPLHVEEFTPFSRAEIYGGD